MNTIKSTIDELYKNKTKLLFFIVILFISQFAIQYRTAIWPKIYIAITLVILVVLFSCLRLRNSNALAKNTFLLIMCLGTINLLAMPVRQDLDENTHFFNALQIADGKIFTRYTEKEYLSIAPNFLEETKLPSRPEYQSTRNTNLYTKEFLKIRNQKADYSKLKKPALGIANPVYLPSAIGISIGRIISPYFFVSYYLGRFFNLLTFGFMAFCAIKISRKYKLALLFMCTVPYTLWITAGYNYDSFYYGLSLLCMAQLTNIFSKKRLTFRELILYDITCLAFVFCKAPVILLMGIPLFLPKNYFNSTKFKIKSFIISIIGLVLAASWMISGTLVSIFQKSFGRVGVDNTVQTQLTSENRLSYFIAHPISTVEMLMRSLFDVLATIFDSITSPHPFIQYGISAISLINIFIIIIMLLIVSYYLQIEVVRNAKIAIILSVCVITIGMIYAISGDGRVFTIGNLHVPGVQGRYHYYLLGFIPLFLSPVIKKIFSYREEPLSSSKKEEIYSLVFNLALLMVYINTCVGIFGYL